MSSSENKAANSQNDSDIIETINLYQSREKIYTRAFKGFYRNLRNYGGALLFLIYFGTVWLQWGDRQAVLLDISTRQFHIFGETFLPQDFILLSWMLIICAFGLFFFTVLAGRVWCGYTCPQSVFTWVFMWVEKVTEGDRNKRMRLDKASISLDKFIRKFVKHLLWLLIALAVSITFVGYFTPIRELINNLFSAALLSDEVSGAVSGWALFWIGFFTLATYGNAGWLREQVCIYMCPYARFQSVMYDKDTLTVHYHATRGEPRASRKRSDDPKALAIGDCIDCNLCVHVCPTGIDIRDGLQYECISCGACIDVCNSIMDKMKYDRGLIAYTSENALQGKTTNLTRPRLIGYFIALCIMTGLFFYTLSHRTLLELEVLRDRQSLYTRNSAGFIENIYTLKLVNKSQQPLALQISVSGLSGISIRGKTEFIAEPGVVESLPIRLAAPPESVKGTTNTTIIFHVNSTTPEGPSVTTEGRFLSPAQHQE